MFFCYLRSKSISYDLIVLLALQNLSINSITMKYEFIVTEFCPLRGFGGHFGRILDFSVS